MADEIDFDLAASAFPDLDDLATTSKGPSHFPALNGGAGGLEMSASSNNGTGFGGFDDDDDFAGFSGGGGGGGGKPEVKVTGDDVLDKFENEFPDIGGAVSPPTLPRHFDNMLIYVGALRRVILLLQSTRDLHSNHLRLINPYTEDPSTHPPILHSCNRKKKNRKLSSSSPLSSPFPSLSDMRLFF